MSNYYHGAKASKQATSIRLAVKSTIHPYIRRALCQRRMLQRT